MEHDFSFQVSKEVQVALEEMEALVQLDVLETPVFRVLRDVLEAQAPEV